jgi:hypothetical protein
VQEETYRAKVVRGEKLKRSKEEKRKEEMWRWMVDPQSLVTLKVKLGRRSIHVLRGFWVQENMDVHLEDHVLFLFLYTCFF